MQYQVKCTGGKLMVRAGLEPGMLNRHSDSNQQNHELAPILNLIAHAVLPLKNLLKQFNFVCCHEDIFKAQSLMRS